MESFPAEEGARTPSLADDPALGLSQRAKLEILGAVMLALFLGALDQTIVGTALPRIVTELGGNEYYNWVFTIYLLTSTITVPFYGKLSDIYGRKPLLMIGVTIFLVGSALSGLSQNMGMLILFRGIQGLGAGSLFPISLAVIGDLFTPQERGKYQGLFGAVFGLSSIIGPFAGGFLTDTVGWHWIFYVNIPIGIVSLFVLARLLPTIKRPDATRNLDFLGAGFFTVAISALLIGLTNKQTADWATPQVGGLIGIGLLLGAVFLLIESRAKEPIIPLGLFRNRTYASSMLSTFLVSFGFFGAIVFLPRWFQFVAGSSARDSGLQILPLLAGLIVSSIVAGILVSRTGRYKPIILTGLASMTVGLALMTQLHANTELPIVWLWMFVAGAGIGPTLSVFTIVVQNAVPFRQLGVATSNLTFFRQIGGSVGLAITGTIFGTRLLEEIPVQLTAAGLPPQAVDQFSGAGTEAMDNLVGVGGNLGAQILGLVPEAFRSLIEPMVPAIVGGIHEAFTIAVTATFQIGIVTTILAFVAALALKEIPLRTTMGEAAPHVAPTMSESDAAAAPPVTVSRLGGAPTVD
ncbi:MAG: MDR family MFS transporter [Candidatus Limnocylindrales bacterium]|nr:MDR family MFS transporter [Candidatus Limnocylindrales bacterium]